MTMPLKVIPIPALYDNYIWVIQDKLHQQCVVIDPGVSTPVLKFLREGAYKLSAILITHRHHDHTHGIEGLLPYFDSEPIVLGPAQNVIPYKTKSLREGDQICLLQGQLCFNIYEIPGHTKEHIAYYSERLVHYPALFCGDTLFSGGCGKLMEGTMDELYHSLLRLRSLPDNTQIYCSHEYTIANLRFAHWLEPYHLIIRACLQEAQLMRRHKKPTLPSSLQKEKLINPFLKCDDAHFIEIMAKRFEIENRLPLEIFSTIRRIKDKWNDTNLSL
jgi:hydroxyacylglutathione hydrolase